MAQEYHRLISAIKCHEYQALAAWRQNSRWRIFEMVNGKKMKNLEMIRLVMYGKTYEKVRYQIF